MTAVLGQVRDISIHAPMKGATTIAIKGDTMWRISIHAPMKGAT